MNAKLKWDAYQESPDLSISEDGGETLTLSLTWKEIHELKAETEQQANVALQEFIS